MNKIIEKKIYQQKKFWLILIGITAFRIIYLAINSRPLNLDEAQYWLWSQHLSLGYHSKPPLIAYAIFLTTKLFGNGYFAVRCTVPICYLLTSIFLYLAAKKLFSEKEAKWTALSFIFAASIAFSSTIISTDPFMLLFWAMALYFLICAIQQKTLTYWILTGIAIGLSALSKYTGLVFLLSLTLYLIFCREVRQWLKSYKPYVMFAVVILLLSPNIIWNIANGFATLKHVAYHNANIQGIQLHPLKLLSFLTSQLAVFSLIFLPVYLYCLFRKKYWQDERLRLLWWFSLPMFFMIIVEALLSRAYANWDAAAYLAATILVVAILVKNRAIAWLKINLIIGVAAMLALYSVDFAICNNLVKFNHNNYPKFYRNLFGWETAGKEINSLQQQYPKANFLLSNRKIWSKSVYYGKLPLNKVYAWNIDLDVLAPMEKEQGKDFIWLTKQQTVPNSLQQKFSKITPLPAISLRQFNHDFGRIYVYYLTNFRGFK